MKWKNEILVSVAGAGGARRRRRQPDGIGRHARRPRDAGAVEEPRAEAVRGVVGDDRSDGGGAVHNDPTGNAGFDFKYGLTRSLIVDATYRTDFAQVEEDLQQINLTRFSLFFPEKRDFFIEGQGIFDFGGVQSGNTPGDVPLMFFSRQIGLSAGRRCRWSAAPG